MTICISILLGFLASRIAVMLCDFMEYKEVFWFVKLNIISNLKILIEDEKFDQYMSLIVKEYPHLKDEKIIDLNLFFGLNLPKSEMTDYANELCDVAENRNGFYGFLLRLISCNFCLSIWASFIISIIAVIFYHVGLETFVLTPIFAYLITEKL